MTSWMVVTSTDNFQRTIDLGFTVRTDDVAETA